MFENSPSGIAFINEKGIIQEVNPRYCQLLDYTPEELLNKELKTIIHPDDHDKVAEMVHLMQIHETKKYENEKRYLKRSGQVIWGLQNVSIQYDERLALYYAIEVVTDLSEQKATTQALETALSELKERNFELDQFVYRTSHDLRSPLTTILGLINLIKIENIPKAIGEYIFLVENRVLKLDNFLQLMLNYLKNTRLEVAHKLIDFNYLIKDCLEDLEYVKGFDKVKVTCNLTASDQLYSDELRLRIIFQNLISNAIKYQDVYEKNSF